MLTTRQLLNNPHFPADSQGSIAVILGVEFGDEEDFIGVSISAVVERECLC